jgi:UPF0755 protein
LGQIGNRRSAIGSLLRFVIRHSIFVIALLVLSCADLRLPGPDEAAIEVRIRPGQSTRAIADSLKAQGVISSPLEFRVLARLSGRQGRLRSGLYRFRPHTEELAVLLALSRGGATSAMTTIPEGWTMHQVAAELDRRGICTAPDFLAACTRADLLKELGIPAASAEGYLFPETYDLLLDSDPAAIIRQRVAQLELAWAEVAGLEAGPLPPLRTVILASIVEREAEQAEEFPTVASVFENRLKKRMPLQSCATVEYVLPERKTVLSYEDTRYQSPYNTYLHPGLPPGPISNPGASALRAALNPARTDYYYYVSRNDGTHQFSKDYRSHVRAVNIFQKPLAHRR